MTAAAAEREQIEFAVVYDGPALREHRMSVRDLAPALLGLADLFQDANSALSPGEPPVSLDIKATGEGSFLIELAAVHEQLVHLLNSPDAVALSVLVTFIMGGNGLFSYLRRKKQIGAEEESLPNGNVRITLPDGTRIEFPAQVLTLAQRSTVRLGVHEVIAPLNREGIDRLELRPAPSASPDVTITAEDVELVEEVLADQDRTLVTDQRYKALLTVTSPNFQGGKWRLNDGQSNYWMAIEDASFTSRIDRHEVRFGKDDRLRGEVHFRQWESEAGDIHVERSVTRVDEHIPAPTQMAIDDFDP